MPGSNPADASNIHELAEVTDDDAFDPYRSPQLPADFNQNNRSSEELLVLATFDNSVDAHRLRNELENAGIDARVANENSNASLGISFVGQLSAFWVEVLIFKSDAERALVVKQQFHMNDDADIPEWTCRCGETVDAGFSACWNCEAIYESDSD